MNDLILERRPKSALSIERHYNVESEIKIKCVLEIRYLENDNGEPHLYYIF